MPPSAMDTVSRVDPHRSRQLICDSRTLIASAKALIAQSRQSIARQGYRKIVCAWCEKTTHWQHAEGIARGQISHSICFDCFAHVFRELAPENALPPIPTKGGIAPHAPYLRLVP
jgi:hypothetical protein